MQFLIYQSRHNKNLPKIIYVNTTLWGITSLVLMSFVLG